MGLGQLLDLVDLLGIIFWKKGHMAFGRNEKLKWKTSWKYPFSHELTVGLVLIDNKFAMCPLAGKNSKLCSECAFQSITQEPLTHLQLVIQNHLRGLRNRFYHSSTHYGRMNIFILDPSHNIYDCECTVTLPVTKPQSGPRYMTAR